MDLFDFVENKNVQAPLAERMRANTLSEFLGQEHVVSDTGLLRRAIKMDRLGSCIFWGPPGVEKQPLPTLLQRELTEISLS